MFTFFLPELLFFASSGVSFAGEKGLDGGRCWGDGESVGGGCGRGAGAVTAGKGGCGRWERGAGVGCGRHSL